LDALHSLPTRRSSDLFRPAEDPLGRRIPQLDPALRVEGLGRQRRGPDHGLERLVALPERPLGPLAFGQQLLGPAPRRFGLRPGGLLMGEPDPHLLRLLPRRRLTLHARPMREPAFVVEDRNDAELHPEGPPVLAVIEDLLPDRLAALERRTDPALRFRVRLR